LQSQAAVSSGGRDHRAAHKPPGAGPRATHARQPKPSYRRSRRLHQVNRGAAPQDRIPRLPGALADPRPPHRLLSHRHEPRAPRRSSGRFASQQWVRQQTSGHCARSACSITPTAVKCKPSDVIFVRQTQPVHITHRPVMDMTRVVGLRCDTGSGNDRQEGFDDRPELSSGRWRTR
jgi:hypothetical protein